LNCHKHSWKGQSGTKKPVKPTWSEKMTVFNTFLESSLNYLSRYSQTEKQCQSLNCHKDSWKKQSGTKNPVKPTRSEKMTVLNTFLKFS